LRGTDAGFLSVSGYNAAGIQPPSALRSRRRVVRADHRASGDDSVYGVRTMHDALGRAGVEIGSDHHPARPMRRLGLDRWAPRQSETDHDRRHRSGRAGGGRCPAEVQRDAAEPVVGATRPTSGRRRLYVLALVIDVYAGAWSALTTHSRTDLPLEALETARWARNDRLDGLIHHSDA
jgi:putative transposase